MFIVNGALEFVKYFKEHWIGDIEIGWTYYGRLIAAKILNVSVDSIPNTNNHLEGFNNQLKNHQLNRFQNNGHMVRLDIMGVLLIKSITPNLLLRMDLKKRLDTALDFRYKVYSLYFIIKKTCLEFTRIKTNSLLNTR